VTSIPFTPMQSALRAVYMIMLYVWQVGGSHLCGSESHGFVLQLLSGPFGGQFTPRVLIPTKADANSATAANVRIDDPRFAASLGSCMALSLIAAVSLWKCAGRAGAAAAQPTPGSDDKSSEKLGSAKEKEEPPPRKSSLQLVGALSACWLMYGIILSPTLGLVTGHIMSLAADRYAYIALVVVGIPAMAIGTELCGLMVKSAIPSGLPFWGIFISLAIWRTRALVDSWHDSTALWHHVIDINPTDTQGWGRLGLALHAQGNVTGAIHCQRTLLDIAPDNANALSNLCFALQASAPGSESVLAEAVDVGRRALVVQPMHHSAMNNLGNALQAQANLAIAQVKRGAPSASSRVPGILKEALSVYSSTLELRPNQPTVLFNMALAHNGLQDHTSALEVIERANLPPHCRVTSVHIALI
jgi:tetratricopeptide (TPR) repeat protein